MPHFAPWMVSFATALTYAAAVGRAAPVVNTRGGTLQGIDAGENVQVFEGIPFAAPPVGERRWREPQPAAPWSGVRMADHFGPRPMQLSLFNDMRFRSAGMSEDCLYLNVWTPAGPLRAPNDRPLPVLVYFYGGGFAAGDSSEWRYDGASLARHGIVVVTVNYRLDVFGFFAHPQLTAESPHHASGDYGLLDQSAALHWVHDNIAAFGGDPARVTIAGQSAGSYSVCAQMASPLSRDLIAGAIGQSGGLARASEAVSQAAAEKAGVRFAAAAGVVEAARGADVEAGAESLAQLRAMSADDLMRVMRQHRDIPAGSGVVVDGYFMPQPEAAIFAAGRQAHVPLLVGWTNAESGYRAIIHHGPPTLAAYEAAVRKLFAPASGDLLRLYPGESDDHARDAASALAGDLFIGYGTWKWADLAQQTGGQPVYRYRYDHPRPPIRPEQLAGVQTPAADEIRKGEKEDPTARTRGAPHAADIEYALGNLDTNPVFAWTNSDYRVSALMESYFANFIKTGDPNGPGLPAWPGNLAGQAVQVMHLSTAPHLEPERDRPRYEYLDRHPTSRPTG